MTSDLTGLFVGPGSQPDSDDGMSLDYMEMPRDMAVFERPLAPEPEDTLGMDQGKAKLNEVLAGLQSYKIDQASLRFELNDLPPQDLGLINQVLGEGEVSIVCGQRYQAQESVLAGVWRVVATDLETGQMQDWIEVAAYPDTLRHETFKAAQTSIELDDRFADGVLNAPSVMSEIKDKVDHYKAGDPTHAINLTLLPQSEQDLTYLSEKLGPGTTVVLSRGYGNCRVKSTGTNNVWWVQYFNSQDVNILNSLEIVGLPDVVQAAQEDIEDSAERLFEIMEVYK